MTDQYKSLESRIREVARQSMQKKWDEAKAASARYTTKIMDEPKPEIKEAVEPIIEEAVKPEPVPEIEIEEAVNPEAQQAKEKMSTEREQVQKQKEQLRLQIAQQRAAKQMQAMKEKGEKSLEKIKEEEELAEWKVRTYAKATKLEKLHTARYARFNRLGDRVKAEGHRKKAIELKRLAYAAKDNPEKLPH